MVRSVNARFESRARRRMFYVRAMKTRSILFLFGVAIASACLGVTSGEELGESAGDAEASAGDLGEEPGPGGECPQGTIKKCRCSHEGECEPDTGTKCECVSTAGACSVVAPGL